MYSQYAISSVAEVPPLIKAFAANLGWTTSGVCILTRPGGGETFSVTAGTAMDQQSGYQAPRGMHHWIEVSHATVYRFNPRAYMPRLNGDYNLGWDTATPTKLHLMGGEEEDTAYIAAVVECGFNLYRHIYIGNIVKIGDYQGGECVSLNNNARYPRDVNNFPFQIYDAYDTRFLFSQSNGFNANYFPEVSNAENNVPDRHMRCGGVKIQHADNPNTWRYFTDFGGFQAKEVLGGWRDGPQDFQVAKAHCSFAGATMLVPVNLWVSHIAQPSRYDARFIPIGHPAGARMVNMRDLGPGNEIEVGNKHWRVFPEFSKRDTWSTARGTAWAAYESTGHQGLAYLVD